MTLVHIDLRRRSQSDGDIGVQYGLMEWQPLQRRIEDDYLVTTESFAVTLVDGVGTCDLPVNTAWKVREIAPQGVIRYVAIPPVDALNYEDLPSVDPATLEPTAEPEAAWWGALAALLTGAIDGGVASSPGSSTIDGGTAA